MKIKYFIEGSAGDFKREGTLPFLPVAGMFIALRDDDCRKVDQVYFMEDENEIAVHFDAVEDGYNDDHLVNAGWEAEP